MVVVHFLGSNQRTAPMVKGAEPLDPVSKCPPHHGAKARGPTMGRNWRKRDLKEGRVQGRGRGEGEGRREGREKRLD